MANVEQVVVPDIGDFKDVEVIELGVEVGQDIAVDDTLLTLESDKASIDIPSPIAGKVEAIVVNVGDRVSQGVPIVSIVRGDASPAQETPKAEPEKTEPKETMQTSEQEKAKPATKEATESHYMTLTVPDIGGAEGVQIIEVNVKPGDNVDKDDTMLTLESDKASMELPAPESGIIREIHVKVGDKVSEGTDLGVLEVTSVATQDTAKDAAPLQASTPEPSQDVASTPPKPSSVERPAPLPPVPMKGPRIHTSPAIRRLAREFGVDLSEVKGTGKKGRILKDDVQNYVKQALKGGAGSGQGFSVSAMPEVDFTKYGPVKTEPLSRIKKLSSQNLHRNWVSIPHVTQFDEVDITEMEAFRKENKAAAEKKGFKLTPLVLLMKAVVASLKAYPNFNASLSPEGDTLVLKEYYHVGVAVDTPHGLVVPVIRDVDQKGLLELAEELAQISSKARALKLTANDMQGSCFTISSLGGIGGTAFTPIINAPDVAILGVSKSKIKPVYQGDNFVPRLMLPLSLSYDHRVIDGAEAARFITNMGQMLADIRRLLL